MKKSMTVLFRYLASFCLILAVAVSCGPEDPQQGTEEPGPGTEEPAPGPTPGPGEEENPLVDSLENVLYRQVRAMQLVLTGEDVMIASCAQKGEEGQYEVSFTSGASFIGLVDDADEFTEVLSYTEADGVKYWAICDKDGNISDVKDAEGKKVSMENSADIKLVDEKYMFKVGENSVEMGYMIENPVQIFSFNPLFDKDGAVYAVEFSFGTDKVKTVYVYEYAGLYFHLPADQEKTALAEMYVNVAGEATLAVSMAAEYDWTPVVPEGWTATVRKEGEVSYVDVKAPENMEGAFADAPQLTAVSEDGSFVFATVALVGEQFKTMAVSVTDAVIAPSVGLGKFAYGIALLSEFDEAAVKELAARLLAGAEATAGNAVSEVSVSKPFAEIFGTELDSEERYVLWAMADGVLKIMEFGEIAVDIEIVKSGLLDAEVNVAISGAASIFGGVMEKSDAAVSEILYQVSNLIYDPIIVDQKFEYNGEASDFPQVDDFKAELAPATSYILWVVPAVDGEYEYTEKDIIFAEFTTNDILPGGSLELTCGEPKVTPSSISFPLSCEGAEMIYYAYLTAEGGSRFAGVSNDEMKFEQIITEDSDYRVGDYVTVVGNQTEAVGRNLNDEAATEYWLYAVAVDADGKYGKVHCVSSKTLALAYDNSITLTVDAPSETITASSAIFKVTSTGGDLSDYIYWVGRVSDPFWANTSYCGGTRNGAQKYMALNPDDENITRCMRKYGPLSADGTIAITDMTMETQYVFVILERGETYFSKAASKMAKTLAADLGEIVRAGSEKWEAEKAKISFDWHKDYFEQGIGGLMSFYSFSITCPKEYTSYIMCASDDYFTEMGLTKVEHEMIEIEKYASRNVDKDHTLDDENGEMRTEPNYVKDGEEKPGQLMSVNDFYVHGTPHEGAVTYFAEGTHGEGNCIKWEHGACTAYERALEKLAYYSSITPYMDRATMFGLKGDEATTWANALLEAYKGYYLNSKPQLYINDGSPLRMSNPYATGVNEDGEIPDRVIVMLKDKDGNYFEPMYFEVPPYFEKK